jgi:dTMP kinase
MDCKIIVLEGGEGTGKTTQTKLLSEALRAKKKNVITYRSPGTTKIGEFLRENVCFNSDLGFYSKRLGFLLDYSNIIYDIEKLAKILPPKKLKETYFVIDRFTPISGHVYQAFGSGESPDWSNEVIEKLNEVAKPSLVLFLKPNNWDVIVDRSFTEKSDDELNENDLKKSSWKKKILLGYEAVMKSMKDKYNIKEINFGEHESPEMIHEKIMRELSTEFKEADLFESSLF